MDQQIFEKISKRIEDDREEMVVMQKHLISIKAISPVNGGQGEYAKSRYLEPILKSIFDKVEELPVPFKGAEKNIRPNFIAILNGKDKSRTMWIMAHMDVVPEGDIKLWDSDPFTAVVKDGRIYGRGSEDNNQAIVSGISVAKAFKEEKITPPINIGLLLVSDEENGSDFGVKHIIKNHRDFLGKDDLIIVPDSGEAKGETIEVAEKSTLWLKVITHGKQSHGANPHLGINAHRAAANFIVKFEEFYKRYPKADPIFDPPTSTFEPTKKENNVSNVNTIPGEDVVYFDCRLLPELSPDKFIEEAKAMAKEVGDKFGAKINIEIDHLQKAAAPTPSDCELVLAAKKAIQDVNGVPAKVIGIGGNTVAQQFRELGLNAIVCSKMADVCHQPNEYCIIDNMVSDTKVWAHIALQY